MAKKRSRTAKHQQASHPDELTPEVVVAVCTRLVRKGYRQDVESFLAFWRPIAESGATLHFVDESGIVTEAGKWIASLLLLEGYLEHGEEVVLLRLPFLLHVDDAVFSRQLWISELLARWHQKGEQKKIERLFFGVPNNGKRSYQRIVEDRQRDLKIVPAVDTLRAQGCGYREAIRLVTKSLKKLGIKDVTSEENVRRIYDKWKKSPLSADPLFTLYRPR